jgi:hypothetical protein
MKLTTKMLKKLIREALTFSVDTDVYAVFGVDDIRSMSSDPDKKYSYQQIDKKEFEKAVKHFKNDHDGLMKWARSTGFGGEKYRASFSDIEQAGGKPIRNIRANDADLFGEATEGGQMQESKMALTTKQLKDIIREELANVIGENYNYAKNRTGKVYEKDGAIYWFYNSGPGPLEAGSQYRQYPNLQYFNNYKNDKKRFNGGAGGERYNLASLGGEAWLKTAKMV